MQIKKTDLIVNADGSIYHLQLRPNEIASNIVFVGDPNRVPMVSSHFDSIEIKRESREFVTHTGHYHGHRLSVVSTGIGTDNIDIVVNEIDALHNIDFVTKTAKENLTSLNFIRIGTSGTIQNDIPIDSFVVSAKAIGFDALGSYYDTPQNKNCISKSNAFVYLLSKLIEAEMKPYLVDASDALLQQIDTGFIEGITATMPGFYAPQGRALRAQSKLTKDLVPFLAEQNYSGQRISNIEMETAGIYLLASALGHHAISFNAILANRHTDEFSAKAEQTIQDLILKVLEIYFPLE